MKTGRLLALMLTAVLAFSAAGCGQKAPEATIGVMSSVPESSQAAQTESAAPASESAAPSESETPAPETPAPTEAPQTQAPETPAPETQAPTEAPQTQAPETPAPTEPPTSAAPETPVPTEPPTAPPTEAPTEAPTEPPTQPMTFTDVNETVWTTGNVNLRTGPATSFDVITVLPRRTQLTRTGNGEGWSRVDYNGQTGYVSMDYLTTEEPPATGGHIVAIDPGHQDHGNYEQEAIGPGSAETKAKVTTGTQGVATGIPEYIQVLQVGLALRDELVRRGYTVVMTRETHAVELSNQQRAAIANSSGAEIFLRLHCNGSTDPNKNGVVSYCPSQKNPWIAHLYPQSSRLAQLCSNHISALTGAKNLGILGADNMSGINWCQIPVSIVEMGYMSNAEEDRKLNDPAYQALLVQALANAVDEYFQ